MKQLSKVMLISSSIALLGYFIKLGANIFLARHITEAIYGDFNLALKALSFFVTLTLFGSNFGTNRFFSKFLRLEEHKSATKYITWNIKLLSVSFLISFIFALFAFGFMLLSHFHDVKHIDEYHLVVYTLWLFPFATITTVIISYLESGKQETISGFINKCVKYALHLLILVIVVLYIDPMLKNTSLIMTLFLVYVITAALSIFMMNPHLSNLFPKSVKKIKQIRLNEEKGTWIKAHASLTLNSLTFSFVHLADLTIIELFLKNEKKVGYYAAALNILEILWVVSRGLFRHIKPEISTLLSNKHSHAQLQKKINHTTRVTFSTLIFFTAIIIFFEKPILLLFGPSYLNASTVVSVLGISTIIYCLANNASIFMLLAGYGGICFYLTMIELIATLIFMSVLTYFYGMIGMAVATGCTALLKLSMYTYYCRTKLNIRYLVFI